ncbi:MAG: tryptophan 7-halogenase [Fischerella sp. CENA71]|nr:tryptophan 7-halogenase [Fischerella sp. CENA71]
MSVVDSYDVAILGTGIGGTMLGAILARNGLRVVMIDGGSHPKFAIGESTVPDTSIKMKLIARRFSVPEIGYLSNFYTLRDNISTGSGVKRGFSFLYHRENREQQPQESNQLPTLTAPFGPDCHWLRHETDAYMFATAVKYGAVAYQNTRISEISFDEQGVYLQSNKGQKFFSRYLVDGSGFNSPLSKQMGLRESEPRYKTNTRSLFTHMVNVKPYDEVASAKTTYGFPYPFSQTTLHHFFEGGWFWIIPFNNHPNSTNPLCSVGLTLDRNIYPKTDISPEEEFNKFIQRFPSIAQQFQDAKAVREWISSDRLQYSSKQIVGDRWSLLPSAAGFIDPLFSGGLSLTCAAITKLSDYLLKACVDNNFSRQRFVHYEKLVEDALTHHDRLISSGYSCFTKGFELWNAWFRVWSLGNILAGQGQIRLYCKYLETQDPAYLAEADLPPYNGALASSLQEYKALFDSAISEVEAMQEERQSSEETANRIFKLFENIDIAPAYLKLSSPSSRCPITFTVPSALRLQFWFRSLGQQKLHQYYSDFNLLVLILEVMKYLWRHTKKYTQTLISFPRDLFITWNHDWLNTSKASAVNIASEEISRISSKVNHNRNLKLHLKPETNESFGS